jgi:hypothetical protein
MFSLLTHLLALFGTPFFSLAYAQEPSQIQHNIYQDALWDSRVETLSFFGRYRASLTSGAGWGGFAEGGYEWPQTEKGVSFDYRNAFVGAGTHYQKFGLLLQVGVRVRTQTKDFARTSAGAKPSSVVAIPRVLLAYGERFAFGESFWMDPYIENVFQAPSFAASWEATHASRMRLNVRLLEVFSSRIFACAEPFLKRDTYGYPSENRWGVRLGPGWDFVGRETMAGFSSLALFQWEKGRHWGGQRPANIPIVDKGFKPRVLLVAGYDF